VFVACSGYEHPVPSEEWEINITLFTWKIDYRRCNDGTQVHNKI